jgi:uncharacterized coiled-coil protein SlyX
MLKNFSALLLLCETLEHKDTRKVLYKMDPFSVATTVVSLSIAIAQVVSSISAFVKQVKEAKNDLDLVSQELRSLARILELMSANDASTTLQDYPPHLHRQFEEQIDECHKAVQAVQKTLDKYQTGNLQSLRWAQSGKNAISDLRVNLEVHKSTFSILLNLLTM